MKYKNFQMNYFNITKYAEQTPMEEWMKKDELSRSKHRTAHTADVLRFLTLWKYGGTYLDLDVVVLKPLDTIVNYAGAESSQYVAIGIINMNQIGIGHDVADMILRYDTL